MLKCIFNETYFFVFRKVELDDSGNYTCFANNDEGADNASAQLTVKGEQTNKVYIFKLKIFTCIFVYRTYTNHR